MTYDWVFLFWEMYALIKRFDNFCDAAHDHPNETPETMVMWMLIQWLLNSGSKCHVLGTRMSIFNRDPLKRSVGRAALRWDAQLQHASDAVHPGDRMVSGFLQPILPDSPEGNFESYFNLTILYAQTRHRGFRHYFGRKVLLCFQSCPVQ